MQTEEPVLVKEPKNQKNVERALIKSMAGCYRVSFQFAETFAPDSDYEYHDRKFSGAKEVVHIIEETEDKISLQHILFISKDMVIKHWRQDWIYENRELLAHVKDHEWKKTKLSAEQAAGTWTQKVYQVDDCPRYEGYGTWVHVDGRHFWECVTDSPLPRREISKRNDYNVLKRHCHIELFENGDWVLDQDNEKIIRNVETGEDTLLCMEKGIEKFTKQSYDPSTALNWWDEQAAFWAEVRKVWAEIIEDKEVINVPKDEDLYMAQFELAEQFTGNKFDEEKANTAIKQLLMKHVEGYQA
ncbi:MAG TPA: DUF6607 family protein [Flavobacteriaceae bacterium]|nr:DUF6607 family protein [Flavobacteriaceae bacterium]